MLSKKRTFTGAIAVSVALGLGLALLPVTVMAQGIITEIIDAAGDGAGNTLSGPSGIAVDGAGNVYVAGASSDNAFRIESAECFLVIGDLPGAGTFMGADHQFETQVGPEVEASYPVLLTDIPEFVLPSLPTSGRQPSGPGGLGVIGVAAARGGVMSGDLPAWMLDGHFAVQVVMWNPQVFPGMPEQCTAGLYVHVQPDGTVITTPYGTDVGGLNIWHEIGTDADGQKVIRFPFSIPGF